MTEATNNTETQTNEAAAPEVKLTRREKLAASYTKKRASFDKLSVELKEIVDEINAIDALANVGVGTAVIISIGKGATAAKVQGTVIGVREDDDGAKQYKVAYGSGFDADVKIVGSSRLEVVPAAPVETPAAE